MTRLTDLSIKALPTPAKGSKTYWDRGLGVRVTASGVKTFITLVGSGKRHAIGRYPDIFLKDARRVSDTMKAEKVLGRHYKASESVSETLETFYSTHLQTLAASTARETERVLRKHFTVTGKLEDVTPRQIHKILDDMKDTPSQAIHTFRDIRLFFNWCLSRQMLTVSPMAGMKPPAKEETRDRVLTDDELKIIWKHSDYYPFGYMLRLLMLTGQRRGEIGQLKWSYIGESAITLPKEITKNGRAHTFQIGPMTKEILKAIPKITDYVFPNRAHSSCFKGYSSAKVHFDNRCPIKEAWSIHDLRRTLATGWQRAGIAITVTEKHLNHVAGSTKGIIGIYQRYSYEPELIEAVEQWDIRLQGLIQ